jgi:aldehyde:ferredoxin oxidoreductase
MFKSPLTGNLGESYAGGRLALAMKLADYGAIVIRGKATSPSYISIHDENVAIRDAGVLWGLRSTYSVGRVLREVEPGAGRRSIIRIGPAGENLVRYANVNVDVYRHFGRLGLGAVFGSKKLKALVISGSKSFKITDYKDYTKMYDLIHNEATKTDMMKKYHELGTSENILPLNELRALPTRNLKQRIFEHAENISGECLAEKYLFRKMACSICPVGCIHIATLRIAFAPGYEYESLSVPYDFEPLYSLGSMLGVSSADGVLMLIERVDRYGLDAISTGVILAWATEALEKGLIYEKDTLGVALRWGNIENYLKAIEYIVSMPNDFYKSLAQGVEVAAQKYGGLEFALALGKNEIAGYHCGPATVLGQIIGARHSHLDNAGYSLDQKSLGNPLSIEQTVNALVSEEQSRCMLNSLVICLFARRVYDEKIVSDALKSIGIIKEIQELKELGQAIYNEKFKFKFREGFSFNNIRLPKRFFETPTPHGLISEQQIMEMLKIYVEKFASKATR